MVRVPAASVKLFASSTIPASTVGGRSGVGLVSVPQPTDEQRATKGTNGQRSRDPRVRRVLGRGGEYIEPPIPTSRTTRFLRRSARTMGRTTDSPRDRGRRRERS